MDWKLLTFIVCSFGFFKDMRPSEAYLTAYLTGPWKNLTSTEVNNEIYPWWTYSYLLWLVPVFLLTDYLRYKPMLIVDGLAYMGTWALLLWAQGVPAMKCMQVTFGLATAAEVSGYYAYLYAIVHEDRYKQIASFTRAACLTGRFVAYLLGQLFVSFGVLDLFQLNIFSFVSVSIAFLIAVILPRATYSELFHARPEPGNTQNSSLSDEPSSVSVKQRLLFGFRFLYGEVKDIYSSKAVVMWSLWWAFASCGSFQVANYIQNLWEKVAPDKADRDLYNGAVEAAGTLLGAISVLGVGFIPVEWSRRGRGTFLMATTCGLNAAFLIIMGRTSEIWVVYVLYDVFRATYQVVITIATAQIAKSLNRQRYGFVFGCNTFVALVIESIITAIVVDESGLGLDVQTQFIVYGGYFIVMAAVFSVVAVVQFRSNSLYETVDEDHNML